MKSITSRTLRDGIKYDVRSTIFKEKKHVGTYSSLHEAILARLISDIAILLVEARTDMQCKLRVDTDIEEPPLEHIIDQLSMTLSDAAGHIETSGTMMWLLDAPQPSQAIQTPEYKYMKTQAVKNTVTFLSNERYAEIHALIDHIAPHLQPEYALTVGVTPEEYTQYFNRYLTAADSL